MGRLTKFFAFVAVLAICASSWRSLQSGGSLLDELPSLIVIASILVAHRLRTRIPERIRSMLIVLAFLLAGVNSILAYGVSAPGAFLVPTGLILCWLLLGGRVATVVFALASVMFAFFGWFVLEHGARSDIIRSGAVHLPIFWVNLLVIQIFVGGVLVMTIRGLLNVMVAEHSASMEAADRLEGILEGIQDAFVVADVESGTVHRANPAAERMFRRPSGTMTGIPLGELVDPSRPWTDSDFKAHAAGTGKTFRWPCHRGAEDPFWTEVAAGAVEGIPRGRLLASFRDIDETVREEKQLSSLNQGLEDEVAKRTQALEQSRKELEFIALAVSDDLRRPLTGIREHCGALRDSLESRLDEDGRDYLDRLERGAERMDVLIDALLGLSSIQGRARQLEQVDMTRVARECCEEQQNYLQGNTTAEGTVAWEVAELPPCTTDAGLVRQVWANIVANAFKFTAGAANARVSIGWSERADGIWYHVADNGPGFDMAQVDKLFRIFQRLRTDGPDGLGIGLATTKRIIDHLGGDIEAESRPGEGATFRFRPTQGKSQGAP